MAVEETLARARADLDAGRTELARQRLRGLVGSYPTRLDVREALAETYRLAGDTAQAGRYAYLSDVRDEAEVAAFEEAYAADPVRMMRALAWRAAEEDAPTETARERLRALRERAEAAVGAPVDWRDPRAPAPPQRRADVLWGFVLAFVLATIALLFLVGVVSAVLHGIDVVGRWLD